MDGNSPSRPSLRAEYSRFFASLSPSEKRFARENGLNKPPQERGFSRLGAEDALESAENEPIPEAEIRGRRNSRPIVALHSIADTLEPIESAAARNFSPAEIRETADDFSRALHWALSPVDAGTGLLAELGRRAAVLFAVMRPQLAAGLEVSSSLASSLARFFGGGTRVALERLKRAGLFYGRCLEWVRRTSSLSAIGERLQLIAYELCPSLIDSATNARLAAVKNKTRQAANKVANCLRDTFSGQKALVMRGYETRRRCREAHSTRHQHAALRHGDGRKRGSTMILIFILIFLAPVVPEFRQSEPELRAWPDGETLVLRV